MHAILTFILFLLLINYLIQIQPFSVNISWSSVKQNLSPIIGFLSDLILILINSCPSLLNPFDTLSTTPGANYL